MQDHFEKI